MGNFRIILGESIKDAHEYGWNSEPEKTKHDWPKMVEQIQNHIGGLNWGYRVSLREKSVTYMNEYAEFTDPHTLKTVNKKGKEKTVTADKFIIASGGRPRYPEIPGAQGWRFMSCSHCQELVNKQAGS